MTATRSTRFPAAVLVTLFAGGLAACGADAQTQPPQAKDSNAPSRPVGAPMGSRHPSKEAIEKRISQLHSELGITSAQSPQWNKFADVMRANADDLSRALEQRAEALGKMSAVESMQSFADIEQTRVQGLQKLAASFGELYATFSDQQKQTADALFRNGPSPHAKHGGNRR
jgi:periplasmic protein CpxP/Spy